MQWDNEALALYIYASLSVEWYHNAMTKHGFATFGIVEGLLI